MKRLALAPLALADLREIAAYIGTDNPVRARRFVAELRDRCNEAARRPLSFRERRDVGPDVRSIVHGRYLILFRETPDRVVILRFASSARDLSKLSLG